MLRTVTILALLAVLAVPALAADEPDPVDEALKRMKDKEQPARLAGTAAAAKLQDAKITSQLVKLLKDKDWHVRQLSIEALRVRTGDRDRKKAALALASRLGALSKSSKTSDEYLQTIGALGDLARKETVTALLDIDLDTPRGTAKARLMAAAEAPYPETVDALIKFISKGRKKDSNRQRQQGVLALRHLTGVSLGHDPDKWRAWWKDNRATYSLTAVKEDREAKAREAEERAKKKEEQR
ncbi:MAG: hypothetical protein ABFS86_15680, partial [Planctomycetota bacterium]